MCPSAQERRRTEKSHRCPRVTGRLRSEADGALPSRNALLHVGEGGLSIFPTGAAVASLLDMADSPKIGLALSGGGFRATSFGLGCLRALHDRDLLKHVSVVSGISGGALLTALYSYGPSDFGEFDRLVVSGLERGLQFRTVAHALRPRAIAYNMINSVGGIVDRQRRWHLLRGGNRTNALRDTLASMFFGDKTLTQISHPGLATVITATDLRTSNAVRFGSVLSSCSALGTIQESVTVAEAVAASAAFPILLPAVDREYTFRRGPDGTPVRRVVSLSDGGIYDNLALSVLEPNRSLAYTPHVYDVDYIIAADAGRGALSERAPRFLVSRLRRSHDVVYRRAQDQVRGRLHDATQSDALRGFVHAYLGMRDTRWPIPVANYVPLERVRNEPTNFAAMPPQRIENVSLRGEQLTSALLAHYLPEL